MRHQSHVRAFVLASWVVFGLAVLSTACFAAEYTQAHDTLQLVVGFPGWGFDTDWLGVDLGVVGAYVRLWGGLGGEVLDVELDGAGRLTYPVSPGQGDLWFEGDTGVAEQNLGIELHGKYKIVVFGLEYEGDLPYIPQTDLRLEDSEPLAPYMLGESVALEDHIDRQELFTIPIGASGIFAGNIGVSITAGNEFVIDFESLDTDKGDFLSDDDHIQLPVSGTELTVGEIVEMIGLAPTLTLLPNVRVGIEVGPFEYHIDIPTYTINVPLESLLEPEYPTDPPRSITFYLLPVVDWFWMNGNVPMTMGRVVILHNFSPNDPTHYMASEDPAFTGAAWQPYSPYPEYMLSAGDGLKEVFFKVKNVHGESEAVSDTITLDTTLPTVAFLATGDTTPPLSGTVVDPTATVSVTVDAQTHDATNHGDGTWTLADDTLGALAEGVYDVAVTVTDEVGNTLDDATTDELAIDLTPPDVAIDFLRTNDVTPQLTGTVNDSVGVASVAVTVNGHTYPANVVGDTWTAQVTDALDEGTYDVEGEGIDLAGNPGYDATADELVIDFSAIVVTVDFLATADTTPPLSGGVDDATADVTVTVNGQSHEAVNQGDGTWTLADDTLSALPEAVYDVEASALAFGGRNGADATVDELAIDLTDPSATVNFLTTNDTTPQLSGTVFDGVGVASVDVTVSGHTYPAVVSEGTWTAEVTDALDEGVHTYNVQALATDLAGNTAIDPSNGELTVDTIPPQVTVDALITSDTTPELTGTMDDPTAEVWVTMFTETHEAVELYNQWVLPDNTLDPLGEGVYDVEVTATDAAGNTGYDATTNELTVDTTAPTASITFEAGNPTGLDALPFSVAFDERVGTSFTAADVTVTGSLASGAAVEVTGADPDYAVTVTPVNPDADGTLGITIGTAVTDLAGNPYAGGAAGPHPVENWCGFATQPQSAQVYAGTAHAFTVAAGCGNGALAYQWKWEDGAKTVHDVGEDSDTLGLASVCAGDAGEYWCEVTYDGIAYASDRAGLEVADPITIIQHPAGTTKNVGEAHTFVAEAIGGFGTLHYQWLHEGYPVGEDSPIHEVVSIAAEDEGGYCCEVTDGVVAEPVTSHEAVLTVIPLMPVAGWIGLGLLAGLCALRGAASVVRKRQG